MTVTAIIISLASAILMLYTGLLFDPASIRKLLIQSNLRSLGLLSVVNFIIIPLATLALIRLLPTTPSLDLTLLILATMPCAPLVPTFVSMAGEPPQWSLFVCLSLSLLSILLLPILIVIVRQSWASGDYARLDAGSSALLALYVLAVYLPLLLGIALRLRNDARGLSAQKRIRPFVSASMLVTLLLIVLTRWDEIFSLSLREIGVFALFELICVAILLVVGPRRGGQLMTTLLPSTIRNFSMGVGLAGTVFSHTKALSYMVVLSALTVLFTFAAIAARNQMMSIRSSPSL